MTAPPPSADDVPGGKYAILAPDTRGHCSWFLTRTNAEHQATMDHPWMKTIYAKAFERGAYVHYLATQHRIFQELEMLCRTRREERPIAAVYDEQLHRSQALESDLVFWCGEAWRQQLEATHSQATARYLQQLREDSHDVWLLLCHHFLQYNAVLSGGQYLGSMVSARARGIPDLQVPVQAHAAAGAAFYDFARECQPTHARVQRYIEVVDQLEISTELRSRMLSCMRRIYGQLLALMDEAYAVAPTEGIAYRASLAQGTTSSSSSSATSPSGDCAGAGGGNGGGHPKVPPPKDPVDRAFTMMELSVHSGQRKGTPILTSVLGRIYDVSVAKDLFGAGGPYEMFAGHDGTYNLAVMSLKKSTLDKFKYSLDDEEKECLSEWIAYFDMRYSRPVGRLDDKRHSVTLHELPRAKKIPFTDLDDEETPSNTVGSTQPPTSRL